MTENRAAPRRRILKSGVIDTGGDSKISCAVRNISETGAAIEITVPLYIPDRFSVAVESEHLLRRCQVVWRKDKRLGVKFLYLESDAG